MKARADAQKLQLFSLLKESSGTMKAEGKLEVLRTLAISGKLAPTRVRSAAWKVFLGLLPADAPSSSWASTLTAQRVAYTALKTQYEEDPTDAEDQDLLTHNPLSLAPESSWTKAHESAKLRAEIEKDLSRLHPTGCEDYFEEAPGAHEQMLSILFVWSSVNDDTSYRQGMHEVLAPIVYVLREEARSADSSSSSAGTDSDDAAGALAALVLGAEHVEADAFLIFSRVMDELKALYMVENRAQSRARAEARSKGIEVPSLPVGQLSKRVQHDLCQRADPQLYKCMSNLCIEPQLYCLRWSRLLFAREFHIEDVLLLWDGIFAASGAGVSGGKSVMTLLDSIALLALAMVLFVREFIIKCSAEDDFSRGLKRLMKYPPVEDVASLSRRARDLEFLIHDSTAVVEVQEETKAKAGKAAGAKGGSRGKRGAGGNAAKTKTAARSGGSTSKAGAAFSRLGGALGMSCVQSERCSAARVVSLTPSLSLSHSLSLSLLITTASVGQRVVTKASRKPAAPQGKGKRPPPPAGKRPNRGGAAAQQRKGKGQEGAATQSMVMGLSKASREAEVALRNAQELNRDMGARIERAVGVLMREWIELDRSAAASAAAASSSAPSATSAPTPIDDPLAEPAPAPAAEGPDEVQVVRAMSELKQISAILLGRLELADCVWQEEL